MKLRRGRHNPYTLYVQWDEEPAACADGGTEGDMFLGAVRTEGFAELLTNAVNADLATLTPAQLDDRAMAWVEAEFTE